MAIPSEVREVLDAAVADGSYQRWTVERDGFGRPYASALIDGVWVVVWDPERDEETANAIHDF